MACTQAFGDPLLYAGACAQVCLEEQVELSFAGKEQVCVGEYACVCARAQHRRMTRSSDCRRQQHPPPYCLLEGASKQRGVRSRPCHL